MLVTPEQLNEDCSLDLTLRPASFADYIGQEKIKESLKIIITAAQKRKEKNIEHLLLYGGSGLGKTTLAHIVANELKANLKITAAPAIEKVGDLASILTNLQNGDVLFIDEAHRLNKTIEEILYPAMEDYKLDIIIGKGPSARTLQLEIPRFTLIAATTRAGLLSAPLRSRFGITHRLDFYSPQEISQIINRSSEILKTKIEAKALEMISQRSRHNPRVANRLLKRTRDYCQVRGDGIITQKLAEEALNMLEIDQKGLEPADRKLLETIINKFNGGPVGVNALAASINEEAETIEDVYEPYLLQIGFLARTHRGRIITKEGCQHLGLKYQEKLI